MLNLEQDLAIISRDLGVGSVPLLKESEVYETLQYLTLGSEPEEEFVQVMRYFATHPVEPYSDAFNLYLVNFIDRGDWTTDDVQRDPSLLGGDTLRMLARGRFGSSFGVDACEAMVRVLLVMRHSIDHFSRRTFYNVIRRWCNYVRYRKGRTDATVIRQIFDASNAPWYDEALKRLEG